MSNFNSDFLLHEACYKVNNPYNDRYIYIYFENNNAYATNGFIAVKVPFKNLCSNMMNINTDLLNGKCISAKSYQEILSYKNIDITEDGIICEDRKQKTMYYFPENKGNLDIPSLFKDLEPFREMSVLTFDVSLLSPLADAMGITDKRLAIQNSAKGNVAFITPYQSGYESEGVLITLLN